MSQSRHVVKLLLSFNCDPIFMSLGLFFFLILQSLIHFEFLFRIREIVLSSIPAMRHLTHLLDGLLRLIFAAEWKI
jgi:hypothetical protein